MGVNLECCGNFDEENGEGFKGSSLEKRVAVRKGSVAERNPKNHVLKNYIFCGSHWRFCHTPNF